MRGDLRSIGRAPRIDRKEPSASRLRRRARATAHERQISSLAVARAHATKFPPVQGTRRISREVKRYVRGGETRPTEREVFVPMTSPRAYCNPVHDGYFA